MKYLNIKKAFHLLETYYHMELRKKVFSSTILPK